MKSFDYKKILKQVAVIFKKKPFNAMNSPKKDWRRMLIIFTVLNIISVFLSFYMFWQINEGNIFNVGDNSNVLQSTIDKKGLEEVISYFDVRQKNFNDLETGGIKTTDPSI